jgi:hypothetical protein
MKIMMPHQSTKDPIPRLPKVIKTMRSFIHTK